jgi:murein L,D-transpeptidase YcbB/YkuD
MKSHHLVPALCALVLSAGAVHAQDARPAPNPAALSVPRAPALPAPAAALKAALARELAGVPEAERTAIDGFFAARDYAPFWTEPGSDRAEALIAALEASGAQGLPSARYDPAALTALFDAPGDAEAATREIAASRASLRFAGDLGAGILDPSAVNENITRNPARPSPAALMARLGSGPLDAVLADLAPASPDYARLVAEKARLEALARAEDWGPAVTDGPTLHPGDSGPRVAELRARLARLGYVVPDAETVGTRFDPALEQAVKAFQRDYGLNDDGVVGALTLAAVNAPAETRLAQVVVNLERIRWMPRDLGERYLYVNIPDFTAKLVEGGAAVWESKVVVGKAQVTETAEFSDVVEYIVVNPTWHIPDSIAIRDYLPKLQRDQMVLKRQGIDLMTRGGTVINPKLVDFRQYTPENFPFRIKQRPSEDNALGQVKFMFPNQHSIYMHDTPHREYFARDVRAYSNGCIRLEKPTELAEALLAGQVPDPAASFAGWVAADAEKHVTLARPVPVHIVYRTVFFDEDGTVRYRPDVYGRDAQIFEALEAEGVRLPAAQG